MANKTESAHLEIVHGRDGKITVCVDGKPLAGCLTDGGYREERIAGRSFIFLKIFGGKVTHITEADDAKAVDTNLSDH